AFVFFSSWLENADSDRSDRQKWSRRRIGTSRDRACRAQRLPGLEHKDDVERPKRNVGNAQKTELTLGRHERNQFRCCQRKQACRKCAVKQPACARTGTGKYTHRQPLPCSEAEDDPDLAHWKMRSDLKLFVILHEKHRHSRQERPAPTRAAKQTENQSRNGCVK